jgi:phage terminase large subunit
LTALHEFIERYGPAAGEEGPVLFASEVFGMVLDPWQERVLRAYGRGERRISIRACHGPGKTALAAVMIWHSMLCRFPQKTVATAPSRSQLEDALVAEVMKWGSRLPQVLLDLFDIKQNRIELRAAPAESFFGARTARAESPEALQGVHSDEGFVLLIADEASGVHDKIFESAAGSMSGHNATTLLLSNPTRSTGFFYDTHHKLADMWFTVRVSAED